MDVNATLDEMRRIAATYDAPDGEDADAYRLAELFRALDERLLSGDFLPKPWARYWQRAVTPSLGTSTTLRTEMEVRADVNR